MDNKNLLSKISLLIACLVWILSISILHKLWVLDNLSSEFTTPLMFIGFPILIISSLVLAIIGFKKGERVYSTITFILLGLLVSVFILFTILQAWAFAMMF